MQRITGSLAIIATTSMAMSLNRVHEVIPEHPGTLEHPGLDTYGSVDHHYDDHQIEESERPRLDSLVLAQMSWSE